MKTFITCLVAFAALFAVNCDIASDVNAILERLLKEYQNLTETETKARTNSSIKAAVAIIKAGELGLRLQGLDYVAQMFDNQTKQFESTVPKMWELLEKETDAKLKQIQVTSFGVSTAMMVEMIELRINTTANHTVNATDTSDKLLKKFTDEKQRVLTSLEEVLKQLDPLKAVKYWVGTIHEHLKATYEGFEEALKTFKTEDIKAKSLQVLVDEMEFIQMNVHRDGTTPKPL